MQTKLLESNLVSSIYREEVYYQVQSMHIFIPRWRRNSKDYPVLFTVKSFQITLKSGDKKVNYDIWTHCWLEGNLITEFYHKS